MKELESSLRILLKLWEGVGSFRIPDIDNITGSSSDNNSISLFLDFWKEQLKSRK